MNPTTRFWLRMVQKLATLVAYTFLLYVLGFSFYAPTFLTSAAYAVVSVLWILTALHMAAGLAGYASIRSRVRARTDDMRRTEEAHGRDHHHDSGA